MNKINNFKKSENIEFLRNLFDKWNKGLQTKSPEVVADFYTEDCLFLPTLNWEFKKWKKWVLEYFKHFLKTNPTWKIVEDAVEKLSDNAYLHTWLYNFEVDWNNKWERKILEARFTYTWKNLWDNNWKITHHHSSLRPKDN